MNAPMQMSVNWKGLEQKVGILRGTIPQPQLIIYEHGLKFLINIEHGHKTGFYLDQRRNRLRVRELAQDKDVLDCFCYTGGFTVNALAGGAKSVLSIDSSADALALAKENIALNDLPAEKATFIEGDVFQLLRRFRDENRSFDMIILDPPKFAPTAAQAERAARGYKDINLFAFKLLQARRDPGHVLMLRRDRRGVVPKNHSGSSPGCRCRRADRRALVTECRPSHLIEFPRGSLSQRIDLPA